MKNVIKGHINEMGNLAIEDFGHLPKTVRRVIGKTLVMPVEFLPAGVGVKAVIRFENMRAQVEDWTFDV
jgi:hypothetical protein